MTLEEKLARALASAYCLGRNREVLDENLWRGWLPEARNILLTGTVESTDKLSLAGDDLSYFVGGTQIVTPQFINGEPVKLDKNIPQ